MPFFGGNITRRRYATGAYGSDGGWVDGAATDSTIAADVQGYANEEDMQHLPSGTRVADTKVLYVDEATLRPVDQDASPAVQADKVFIEDHWYQVMAVRDHRNLILHQKVIVVRELGQ